VHVLACLTFNGPRPTSNHTVDHIDRDLKNNNVKNLRWASKSLQITNRTFKNPIGIRILYTTMSGTSHFNSIADASRFFKIKKTTLYSKLKKKQIIEIGEGTIRYDLIKPDKKSIIKKVPSWILHNANIEIYANDNGLIKTNSVWSFGSRQVRTNYYSIDIGGKKYQVHRLVAAAFLEPPGSSQIYVNHKDGDRSNNVISNLEWCSPSENNLHAVKYGLMPTTAVVQYDLQGKKIAEFTSVRNAALQVKGFGPNIFKVCNGLRKTAYGFIWSYKNDNVNQYSLVSKKTRAKEVYKYDNSGKLIRTFASGRIAAKELGLSVSKVSNCCTGKQSVNNFTLKN
jgi:hypothetical protein